MIIKNNNFKEQEYVDSVVKNIEYLHSQGIELYEDSDIAKENIWEFLEIQEMKA